MPVLCLTGSHARTLSSPSAETCLLIILIAPAVEFCEATSVKCATSTLCWPHACCILVKLVVGWRLSAFGGAARLSLKRGGGGKHAFSVQVR